MSDPAHITPKMLADIDWIYRTLMTFEFLGGEPPSHLKQLTKDVVGRSLEFAKGAFWAHEIAIKEKLSLANKYGALVGKLRSDIEKIRFEIDALKNAFEDTYDS